MANYLEMWRLIVWRCGGSLFEDVVAHYLAMWWLIGLLLSLQTAAAEVPGSYPESSTVENSKDRQDHCVLL